MPTLDQYKQRKREIDDPRWESDKNAHLMHNFKLVQYVKSLKHDEHAIFWTQCDKAYFNGLEYKLVPELDAFLEFFYFLKQSYDCEWIDDYSFYCIIVRK